VATGERDAFRLAVVPHGLVHQHAKQATHGKWKEFAGLGLYLNQPGPLTKHKWRAFRPATRNGGTANRLDDTARVGLEEAGWWRIVPVSVVPQRR